MASGGLLVEELRRLGPARPLEICSHWSCRRVTSRASSSALAPSAAVRTIRPALGRAEPVEDLPQPLALVVGQALGDAVGVGLVRDHHHEAAGQADLLGEAGALGPDRVLGDLDE